MTGWWWAGLALASDGEAFGGGGGAPTPPGRAGPSIGPGAPQQAPAAEPSAAGRDGFVHLRDQAGCRIAMRPESHRLGAAMRADCTWPEIDPGHLAGLIVEYERYPELVFPVDVARIEREEADRTLVYQRQHLFGIADREVLLWMRRSVGSDGATRVSWEAATEEPLELDARSVRTPRNTGYWEVGAGESGGARVVHEIALDPGGYVPRWVVDLVRAHGFARVMYDVRVAAAR